MPIHSSIFALPSQLIIYIRKTTVIVAVAIAGVVLLQQWKCFTKEFSGNFLELKAIELFIIYDLHWVYR